MREFLMIFPKTFRFIQAKVDLIQLISVDIEEDLVYKPTERAEDPERAEDRERMDVSDEESVQFPQPQQSSEYEHMAAQVAAVMNMLSDMQHRFAEMAERQQRLNDIVASVDTLMDRVNRIYERMHEVGSA